MLRREARDVPVSVFYEKLVEEGEILPRAVSYTTISESAIEAISSLSVGQNEGMLFRV
ncbi:MAG TPA: hypothetical protein GXX34_05605 [Clostridia bacterium]|nr:hypothetical protein [Clostridia bacterium]